MSSQDRRARPGSTDETRQYLVECDDCSFEATADGRDRAAQTARQHLADTGHDVVAVEVPPDLLA